MQSIVPSFLKGNPFRSPQWRSERAKFLVANGRKPERYDDSYVRGYRRLLLAQGPGAGTGMGPYLESPHAFIADSIYNYPDREWRDILQARLLTKETFAQIAQRFGIEEEAVAFYESIFFDVRDRMANKDWIAKVIVGTPEEREANNKMGTMTAAQRAMVYRLFAYYGGPEVLDSMVTGIMPQTLPNASRDIEKWLEKAMEQVLNTRATQAARVMEINKFNIMQVLEIVMGRVADRNAATTATGVHASFDEFAEKVTGTLGPWCMSERTISSKGAIEAKLLTGALEPTVVERLAAMRGEHLQSAMDDELRVDMDRLQITLEQPESESSNEH